MADIVVLGQCSQDLFVYVPRLPQCGETLHGTSFMQGYGGKGANQAAMAAILGSSRGDKVQFIGKLGTDFGKEIRQNLKNYGVLDDFLFQTDKISSGTALITVSEKEASNSIVIIPAANHLLTDEEIFRAADTIQNSKLFIAQLELQLARNLTALKIASA